MHSKFATEQIVKHYGIGLRISITPTLARSPDNPKQNIRKGFLQEQAM